MVKWNKFFCRIPFTVQASRTKKCEVVWIDEFKDPTILGETRFQPDQIVLKKNESKRETVHTFLHEVIHYFSDTYDIGLTETQVKAAEKALYYILKSGNIFTKVPNGKK